METVVEVIGVNGDSVTLAGDKAGVDGMWLASDVKGLYDPEVQAITQSPGNRAGARFVSHRVVERTINFVVSIENGEGLRQSWRHRDARWRRLWAYDDYSTIRVTTEDGVREIKVRMSEIAVDTGYDPHVNQVTDVLMTVVADDPFWYGTEYVKAVYVNKKLSLTVEDANPTGNPVFPVWVLEAPGRWTLPDWSPKDPNRKVRIEHVPENAHLLVQTDPMKRQVVADNDLPVWQWMNGVRWRNPIPPYTDKVTFTVECESSEPRLAQLRLARPYDRPWGV